MESDAATTGRSWRVAADYGKNYLIQRFPKPKNGWSFEQLFSPADVVVKALYGRAIVCGCEVAFGMPVALRLRPPRETKEVLLDLHHRKPTSLRIDAVALLGELHFMRQKFFPLDNPLI